jgi:hypothetical protein
MDQDTVVMGQIDGGKSLIESLRDVGFDVRTAFWARPTDDEKWFLYLASPVVDAKGLQAAYGVVHRVIRQKPELWIDPFEVRVLGENDTLAVAAREVIKPRMALGPFAVPNPKPHVGMTRFNGSSLGGVSVDGVYIYPPSIAAVSDVTL